MRFKQKNIIVRSVGAALLLSGFMLGGCTTVATANATTHASEKKDHQQLDAESAAVLPRLYETVHGSRELVEKASGVLVFPHVIAAGLGVGGQYGEGVLRSHGEILGRYSLGSVSVGLQAGAQSKAVVILFMTNQALEKFRHSQGWAAGADASVAVLHLGANGSVDVSQETGPVAAFILTNEGLMANLTLEGTKITRLEH